VLLQIATTVFANTRKTRKRLQLFELWVLRQIGKRSSAKSSEFHKCPHCRKCAWHKSISTNIAWWDSLPEHTCCP